MNDYPFSKLDSTPIFPKFEGNKETHVFKELFIAKLDKIDSLKKSKIIFALSEKFFFAGATPSR